MKKKSILYMRVTADEFELPIAVAGSPKELAQMLGKTRNAVNSAICHKNRGWCKVEIEEDEDEEHYSEE